MSTIKTTINDASVEDFINKVEDDQKRQDSFRLLEMYKKLTGEIPKMWGTSIIGFGQYHYKSERSRQEGDWMLGGFSPRKQSLTLYLMLGHADYTDLLDKLGKHKRGGGCLYINKLTDVDEEILQKLIKQSYENMKKEAA